MTASTVYFTNMRCRVGVSLLEKLDRLILEAGIEKIEFTKKFVAIKIHFGEPGNLSFLRPNFALTVAKRVKALGGAPFLTDCNTLYVGRRNNALAHLDAAYENGYSPFSTGCQVIIADGLKGTDEVEAPIPGGILLQSAKIGRAIMDADVFISLNHFKGHEITGFGGAIKNVGMGSGSRAGKMVMHNAGKPDVSSKKCVGCRTCARYCAQSAISFNAEKKAKIDHALCVGCGRCIGVCNYDAIYSRYDASNLDVNCKMAEYAKAVVDGRPQFHINVVNQVSPYCDCHSENDAAVVPDIGMFASFDPVALDRACIDAVNAAPALTGTLLDEKKDGVDKDHFHAIHPTTDWRGQIAHAEKIGLGSSKYELVTVKD
ncbi:MAG: DUF362 domain-containing protein [Desulfovibrio sp.]|jgi:uncharacterized Fe-S center protein|nr:DUF362 domain-containing protein [Desulfovibrio sp.]